MLATRRHLKRALAALGVARPRVAYVGAAANDHAGFFKLLSALFVGTGAHLDAVLLARKNASVARARRWLDDSDAVFLSGGDVEHGMNVLRDRGVDDHLRRVAAAGK